MLKMQFSMACKFTLQPLRKYDVKPPEKTEWHLYINVIYCISEFFKGIALVIVWVWFLQIPYLVPTQLRESSFPRLTGPKI